MSTYIHQKVEVLTNKCPTGAQFAQLSHMLVHRIGENWLQMFTFEDQYGRLTSHSIQD